MQLIEVVEIIFFHDQSAFYIDVICFLSTI